MRLHALTLCALILGFTTACESQTDSCIVAATYDAVLEIGQGEEQLELIEDGDRLTVSRGGQGGEHVWIGAVAGGIAPGRYGNVGHYRQDGPDVYFELLADNGAQVGEGSRMKLPLEGDEYESELTGVRLYLEASESGQSRDEEYTLLATLTDRCGTQLSAERHVVLSR